MILVYFNVGSIPITDTINIFKSLNINVMKNLKKFLIFSAIISFIAFLFFCFFIFIFYEFSPSGVATMDRLGGLFLGFCSSSLVILIILFLKKGKEK